MKKLILTIVSIPVLFILILVVNYIIFQSTANRVSQGKPITQKDSIKQAVLVIDIQEGTTGNYSDDEYYKMKSKSIIDTINILADSSVKNQIPVIYIKSVIHNFLINILNDTYAPKSPGSKLDARLKLASDNIFSNSEFDSFLVKNGINKLVITGLDLAGCVNSTVLAADNREYDICLISDAVLAKSDSLKKVKLDEFKHRGYEIIPSEEYIDILDK